MQDDRRSVQAALRGDPEAYGELVRAYQGPLIASAYQFVRNLDDAQDLAQEALVEAYGKLRQLRHPDKFRPWVFAILRNKCLTHLQARPQEVPLEAVQEMAAPPDRSDIELDELLGRLSLADREVLAARYLQELSFREIAALLRVTVHAAEVRCARARERLRAVMQQTDEVEVKREMQKAMGVLLIGGIGESFTQRTLQEVTKMHTAHAGAMAAGTTGTAIGLKVFGLLTAGVVLVGLLTVGKHLLPGSNGGDGGGGLLAVLGHFASGRNAGQEYVNAPKELARWGKNVTNDPTTLNSPVDLAIDAKGQIFVANDYTKNIQVYNADGAFVTQWGQPKHPTSPQELPPGELWSPITITLAPDGSVYVLERGSARVTHYTAAGEYLDHWQCPGYDDKYFGEMPDGLAVDSKGRVYVAFTTHTQRVQQFSADGTLLAQWETLEPEYIQPQPPDEPGKSYGPLGQPVKLTVDAKDRLFVMQPNQRRIRIYTAPETTPIDLALPGKSRPWLYPEDVTLDRQGRIYLAGASGDPNVAVLDPTGAVLACWSLGTRTYAKSLALDPSGRVVVLDPVNAKIVTYAAPVIK